MEVTYFQAFIDGVDFVFIDSHMFRHIGNNIYGGNHVVNPHAHFSCEFLIFILIPEFQTPWFMLKSISESFVELPDLMFFLVTKIWALWDWDILDACVFSFPFSFSVVEFKRVV